MVNFDVLFLLPKNLFLMHEDATPRRAINEPLLSSSVKNTPIWMITFSKKQGPVFPELWEVDLSGTKGIASREWRMTD